MSRIYFHSPTHDAKLADSERAWLRGMVEDIAVGMLELHHADRVERLVSLADSAHYVTSHARQHPDGMPLTTAGDRLDSDKALTEFCERAGLRLADDAEVTGE